jgi:hypothetical protein
MAEGWEVGREGKKKKEKGEGRKEEAAFQVFPSHPDHSPDILPLFWAKPRFWPARLPCRGELAWPELKPMRRQGEGRVAVGGPGKCSCYPAGTQDRACEDMVHCFRHVINFVFLVLSLSLLLFLFTEEPERKRERERDGGLSPGHMAAQLKTAFLASLAARRGHILINGTSDMSTFCGCTHKGCTCPPSRSSPS